MVILSDDLLPKFGDRPLSPETNVEDIHTKFGVTCKCLLQYLNTEDYSTCDKIECGKIIVGATLSLVLSTCIPSIYIQSTPIVISYRDC